MTNLVACLIPRVLFVTLYIFNLVNINKKFTKKRFLYTFIYSKQTVDSLESRNSISMRGFDRDRILHANPWRGSISSCLKERVETS